MAFRSVSENVLLLRMVSTGVVRMKSAKWQISVANRFPIPLKTSLFRPSSSTIQDVGEVLVRVLDPIQS